jgi:hypothetical protein
MQIINPSSSNMKTVANVLRWAQSVFKMSNGATAIAQPGQGASQDANGVYNEFIKDNVDCVLLYIGANGSGATLSWAASNTGQAINHGLLRQPIGFIPVYKNKTCDIYSTATPTTNNITLAITDDTATTIVMVF